MDKLNTVPIFLILLLFSANIPHTFADSFARPDSSPSTRWVNGIGLTPCSDLTPHFCVDEPVRDDSDYIQTIGLGNGGLDTQFFTLSNIPDPNQSTGHFLRYTLREGNQGTNPVGFTIILRQGANVIATFTHAQGSLPTTFTLFQQTLTNAQADSITDYNSLELTLQGFCTTGCGNSPSARERVAVSWVEFAVETQVQPPTLLTVDVVDVNTLKLRWQEPIDNSNILSYNIQENAGLGFVNIANVPVGTTEYDRTGLIPNTTYAYRLVSIGTTGNSIPSNEISQTTTIVVVPPDYSRPDSSNDLRWVDGIGTNCTSLNNFLCVDEKIRDDSNYIQTIGLGNGGLDTQFFTMSNIKDPQRSDGHTLRYTLARANQGTNPVEFEIILRQGPAVIANWIHQAGTLPTSVTLYERVLTQQQTDSITDYNSLELTLIGRCDSSCGNNPSSREKIIVTWIEFEIIFPASRITAEKHGTSSLIKWEVPVSDSNPPKYIIQRSEDSSAFINLLQVNGRVSEPVINTDTKRQLFWALDDKVNPEKNYVYKVISSSGINTLESTETNPVLFQSFAIPTMSVARGYLIQANNPIPPINPVIGWFDWLKPNIVSAEDYSDSIFTTSINPNLESYRIALEPLQQPNGTDNCNESLEIIYTKNDEKGQDFTMTVTIFENQIHRDDNGVNGEEVETEVEIPRYQQTFTDFTDSTKLKQKWLVIYPDQQLIFDYNRLEIQIDISGNLELDPLKWRSLSVEDILFYIPTGVNTC